MNCVASPAQDTVNLQLKWSIPKQAAMWDTFYNSTSDCKGGLRLQREQRFRAEKEGATERDVTKRALRLQRESSSSVYNPMRHRALSPSHSLSSLRVNDNVRPCSDTEGPEQASVIYMRACVCALLSVYYNITYVYVCIYIYRPRSILRKCIIYT